MVNPCITTRFVAIRVNYKKNCRNSGFAMTYVTMDTRMKRFSNGKTKKVIVISGIDNDFLIVQGLINNDYIPISHNKAIT